MAGGWVCLLIGAPMSTRSRHFNPRGLNPFIAGRRRLSSPVRLPPSQVGQPSSPLLATPARALPSSCRWQPSDSLAGLRPPLHDRHFPRCGDPCPVARDPFPLGSAHLHWGSRCRTGEATHAPRLDLRLPHEPSPIPGETHRFPEGLALPPGKAPAATGKPIPTSGKIVAAFARYRFCEGMIQYTPTGKKISSWQTLEAVGFSGFAPDFPGNGAT
jgi:hypothetical protein